MSFSSRPVPTSRNNACPVCDRTDGACRILADDAIFCHSFVDAVLGEKVNGYVCVKPASGHTATFKPDNSAEWNEQQRREWSEKKLARLEKAREEEKVREERSLSPEKRHELYSLIFERLSLDPVTLSDLERRGFTKSDIEACNFKSVVAGLDLGVPFDKKLPGIGGDGRSLATKNDGYLCPIYDINGNIVAAQIRLHNPPDGNRRYRWLSTPNTATLQLYPEGENPLTVVHPEGNPEGIGLVEGTGAKPFLAARRLRQIIIGAAGGQWSSSPKLLKRYLEQLHSQIGGKKLITLFPDAGDVSNRGVVQRWNKVVKLLEEWGWTVQFGWWGQSIKSMPDIDELHTCPKATIRYISTEEFWGLCRKWGGLAPETIVENLPDDYHSKVAAVQKKLNSLSYAVDLVCDSSQKYLPSLVELIPLVGLVGIDSPKGSGKSYQVDKIKQHCCGYYEDVVSQLITPISEPQQLELINPEVTQNILNTHTSLVEKKWNKGLGMKFLSINARIALGREQAIRWNFTWIEDADIDGLEEFGGQKIAKTAVIEEIDGIGLCWDSLNKIFGRDWSNTLVVIDEIELGLNHVSTSSTCRDRRSLILHTLEQKLRECLNNGGLVLVADADLSDVSLDYLTAIAPGHTPYIVGHDFKGDPWEINFYTGKRDVVLSQIEEWISDPECEPIAVAIDNQAEVESLCTYLLEKYPWLSNEVGGLIRIDSKTTQSDFGRDFVKRPNQHLEKHRPKILVYSPSLGVGCSIDIIHFTHVFGLFFGSLEPSQCRQMLGRVRQSVPRTVWARMNAGRSENESSSYLPDQIKRHLFSNNDGMMTTLLTAMTKAQILAVESGIEHPEDNDILPLLIETLQGMMGSNGSWNNPHIDLYCKQIARRNYALSKLAEHLKDQLIDEGHHVFEYKSNASTNTAKAVSAGKVEIKVKNSQLTVSAPDITYEQAQSIKRKPTRSESEEHAMTKAFLKHELPGIQLTPEFVLKAKYHDDGRWLKQAKLFWYLHHLDAVQDKDETEWKLRLHQFSQGVVFLPDVRTDLPKVEAILNSTILEWISLDDLETEYRNDSPAARAFVKNAYLHRQQIKAALNITVKLNTSPIKLANRILERIGLGLGYSRYAREGKNRIRYYKLSGELVGDGDRTKVWQALDQRWEQRKQRIAETYAPQALSPVQNELNILYNNHPSAPVNQPNELGECSVSQGVTNQPNQYDVQMVTGFTSVLLSEFLPEVTDKEMYEQLIDGVEKAVVEGAMELVSPEVRERIQGFYQEQKWEPEAIPSVSFANAQLTEMLEDCEDSETLGLLRRCKEIPVHIFKLASRWLSTAKRFQIRQWVLNQNAGSA